MPKVYILILNYKNWRDVIECLETVFRSTYQDYSVIVIDNNSGNNSLDHIAHWATHSSKYESTLSLFAEQVLDKPILYQTLTVEEWGKNAHLETIGLTLVQSPVNRGFAAGINSVLRHLLKREGFVWLLNPDVVVEENTLEELVDYAIQQPKRTIVGSNIKYYDHPLQTHLYGGGRVNFNSATIRMNFDESENPEMDYVSGCSIFTGVSSFNELGLLPEEYFLYWEETDWCYRAKQMGYSLQVCQSAICYDKVSGSIGKSFLADYYYTRNGLRFVAKYKKDKLPIALVSAFFRVAKRAAGGQWKRAHGVYKGMRAFLNQ